MACDEERGAPGPEVGVGQRGFDAVVGAEEACVQGADGDGDADVSAAGLGSESGQGFDESDVFDQGATGCRRGQCGVAVAVGRGVDRRHCVMRCFRRSGDARSLINIQNITIFLCIVATGFRCCRM